MKTIVITGANSGLGKAIAIECLQNGYSIIAHYRNNKEGINELMKLGEELGIQVLAYGCELSIEEEVKKFYDFCLSKVEKIDILVNNAGGYIGDGDERDGSSEIRKETYLSNIFPVLLCSKYFATHFLKNSSGSIINIASRHGVSGQLDCISYASAKAAIINISQAYAKLLAPYGNANAISPGPVNTGYWLTATHEEIEQNKQQIRMKKFIEPEEIAKAVVYVCLDSSSMTGQNILIDGGYSVI